MSAALFLIGSVGLLRTTEQHSVVAPARWIPSLQARLAAVPNDAGAWAALGAAYVQSARTSGDPSFYPKAEGALRRALSLQPSNSAAFIGMSSLSAARHDFRAALSWAQRAQTVTPHVAAVYGVLGDALVELGRYPEAFAAFQQMVDLRPDLSSYARASYARELQGDRAGAVAAMELAFQAASSPADAAWASFQLGELSFSAGALDGAASMYQRARRLDPSFVPAIEGLAKVDATRGNAVRAIAQLRDVTTRMPLPQYVIELIDVLAVAGRDTRDETGLLAVEEKLARANGVNLDLEVALYQADHGSARAAVAAARAEWNRRESIFAADVLGWALHAEGHDAEALTFSERALALGTRNALMWFHRGMIERTLGHREAARGALARALQINPHFSVRWSPVAARTLASLGGAV